MVDENTQPGIYLAPSMEKNNHTPNTRIGALGKLGHLRGGKSTTRKSQGEECLVRTAKCRWCMGGGPWLLVQAQQVAINLLMR